MRQLARVMLAVMLLTIVAGTAASLAPSRAQAAPLSSSYCGQLGEYTAWHYTAGEWKRVLWVWNNGHSTPYPDAVIVYYNGQLVENSKRGYKPTAAHKSIKEMVGLATLFPKRGYLCTLDGMMTGDGTCGVVLQVN